ncbi:DNA phosphorothioation system sulfurtransferase DndC [Azospirillum sp. YIM DDC1]|uniref:DNA phosphorothioation system sulfurtransferase DndC n=1 Tax=Azospirillum aestuarii TaxID=2802052 RepID=A0ABS1HRT3_9PROT|nr:DNA phosphorothioation system sulfurtransferase DndC [Azospirillum aestuarii]MBK4717538.1 DNA phosphorothioation system sulfurtransferase DndC [Azospirillum aestuarii]
MSGEGRRSAFSELGFRKTVALLLEEISELYWSDGIPWVVGYSGGKDSTATLQLVWMALAAMPEDRRTKQVHVISTDTLVENPVVAGWVNASLGLMAAAAERSGLPISVHRLTPDLTNSFWVNLIGRGYPAPRPKFRWCTERLKIYPSNRFISEMVRENGEAIVVLGTRKAESQARAKVMARAEARRVRGRLSPNESLPSAYIYSPVEEWTNDDIWMFLTQTVNPWDVSNDELMNLYQGASPDGECPLVIDSSTPSCGDSRFGCWVCTMVEQDKSMQAMIVNDSQKEWMRPLLELRNELDEDDRELRDFRRMNGQLTLYRRAGQDALIHGPYTQQAREMWLRKLLCAQRKAREAAPEDMKDVTLVSLEELEEIRRIWVTEKHEIEDSLPRIYAEECGEPYPGGRIDDAMALNAADVAVLERVCGDRMHFQLVRELLSIERKHRTMVKRPGIYRELEEAIRRGAFDGEEDALAFAVARRDALNGETPAAIDALLEY